MLWLLVPLLLSCNNNDDDAGDDDVDDDNAFHIRGGLSESCTTAIVDTDRSDNSNGRRRVNFGGDFGDTGGFVDAKKDGGNNRFGDDEDKEDDAAAVGIG